MLPGNIFLVSLKPGALIDLEEAKDWIKATNALLDLDHPYRGGIYDISLISKITDAARDYLSSGEDVVGTVVGVGIVSNSTLGRTLGNMYMEQGPARPFPVRFFESPISAEHWIRTQIREHAQRTAQEEVRSK